MTEQELKLEALDRVCSMREFSLHEIAKFLATPLNPLTSETANKASIPSGKVIYFDDASRPDGIYICYKDGNKEPFTGQNSKEDVDHIGIKRGNILFGLQLKDKGIFQLLRDGVRCPEKADHYTSCNKRNAFEDFDYETATKRIKDLGTDIPLEDGEYLPTIGLWGIMMMSASTIQAALRYVDGDELTDEDWYWSVTEYSQYIAWSVNFNDGYTYSYYKYYSGRVRAVVAF